MWYLKGVTKGLISVETTAGKISRAKDVESSGEVAFYHRLVDGSSQGGPGGRQLREGHECSSCGVPAENGLPCCVIVVVMRVPQHTFRVDCSRDRQLVLRTGFNVSRGLLRIERQD